MEINFSKLSACGNDFVAIDNRGQILSGNEVSLIQYLCDRRRRAGADGLLLVEKDPELDFKMRIFNPDGSEARMCGNGARACAMFASRLGIPGNPLSFSTIAGRQTAFLEGNRSRLLLSAPEARGAFVDALLADPKLVSEMGDSRIIGFARVGVPHLLVEATGDPLQFPIEEKGPWLRYHPAFAPEGTNVMFVWRQGPGKLFLRAWEKGVEAETWGCGTGAVAAVLLLHAEGEPLSSTVVHMKGGDLLVEQRPEGLCFSGEVHEAYRAIAVVL